MNDELKFGFTISNPKYTLRWHISEDVCYGLTVKKTWYNRWKWWITTKLFLPGNYKWL